MTPRSQEKLGPGPKKCSFISCDWLGTAKCVAVSSGGPTFSGNPWGRENPINRSSAIFVLPKSLSAAFKEMADCNQVDDESATPGRRMTVQRSRRSHALVDNPKQLAAMFASMVTVPGSENDWIARNGDESLFKVLERMLPEVRSKSSPIPPKQSKACVSSNFLLCMIHVST